MGDTLNLKFTVNITNLQSIIFVIQYHNITKIDKIAENYNIVHYLNYEIYF